MTEPGRQRAIFDWLESVEGVLHCTSKPSQSEPLGAGRRAGVVTPGETGPGSVWTLTQRIYIGNLPYDSTEDQVRDLFSQHGEVVSCALPTDRETGRPRGFGFVEMSPADADAAIAALDGQEMDGRNLRVNEAQPRRDNGGGQSRQRW